jgi:hypothetical protein
MCAFILVDRMGLAAQCGVDSGAVIMLSPPQDRAWCTAVTEFDDTKSDTELNEGSATSPSFAILVISDVFNLFALLSFQLPTTFPPIRSDRILLLSLEDVSIHSRYQLW